MARFKKLNAALDRMEARLDTMTDAQIHAMMNSPEALARAEVSREKNRFAAIRKEAKRTASREAAVAANVFQVGQAVRHIYGKCEDATVAAVKGSIITLDNGRSFAASAFIAA